jgi:hypothetical protein
VVFGDYDLSWHTIDGGGASSSGGGYVLESTGGQPDVDALTGGGYELQGGFWGFSGVIGTGVAEYAATSPRGFRLYPSVPNPFNPSTVISFELPAQDVVRVSVYTPRGVLVRRLIDESRAAGRHQVAWDGRDDHGITTSSGIYIVRVEAGEHSSTQKITLLK